MMGPMKTRALSPNKKIGPDPGDARSLQKRYLFWLYKTTKDELDRIDRKLTQLDVDREMLDIFRRDKGAEDSAHSGLQAPVKDWENYIAHKEADARKLLFDDEGRVLASYYFLRLKLKAILGVTRRRFGAATVRHFKRYYEEASMKLIMQDTSGRR